MILKNKKKKIILNNISKSSLITFLTLQLICLVLFYYDFISNKKILEHDSIVIQTSLHVFYNQIFNGENFLWNPFLNSGQPLWPQVETVPVIDPIVLIVWSIGFLLDLKATLAYSLTVYFWLICFSLGAFFCIKELSKNYILGLSYCLLIMLGPTGFSSIAQSQGFIEPHRYTPFIFYIFLLYRKEYDLKYLPLLALLCSISISGYQTLYSGFFSFLFITLSIMMDFKLRPNKRTNVLITIPVLGILILPSLLPVATAGYEIFSSLYSVPHNEFLVSYSYDKSKAFLEFFIPFLSSDFWHGGAVVGLSGIILFMSSIFTLIIFFTNKELAANKYDISLIIPLIISLLICAELTFNLNTPIRYLFEKYLSFQSGRESYVMMLRNWGFSLSIFFLLFIMLSAIGFKHFSDSKNLLQSNKFITFYIISTIIINLTFLAGILFIYKNINIIYLGLGLVLFNIFNFLLSKVSQDKIPIIVLTEIILIIFINKNNFSIGIYNNDMLNKRSHNIATKAKQINFKFGQFDYENKEPFHYEGPTILRKRFSIASTKIPTDTKLEFPITGIATQFRLIKFQKIWNEFENDNQRSIFFGSNSPFIYFANQIVFVKDDYISSKKAVNRAKKSKSVYEFRKKIFISKKNDLQKSFVDNSQKKNFKILNINNTKIFLKVDCLTNCFLIYDDAFHRGWNVIVNGEISNLYNVNGFSKGVMINPGQNFVEFKFDHPIYKTFFLLRIIGQLFLLILCLYSIRLFNLRKV